MTQPDANVPVSGPQSQPMARRKVLAGAGAVGALGAAAAVASLPLRQDATAPVPTQAQPGPSQGGYQLTEHVLHYYRTARV